MPIYKIRPHHMLCLQYFEGKGYSEEFVKNMFSVKEILEEENPKVEIVNHCDDICKECPNRINGFCKKENEVIEHDKRVYEKVKKDIEGEITWSEITELIHKNIIDNGKLKQVCKKCKWSDICFNFSSQPR